MNESIRRMSRAGLHLLPCALLLLSSCLMEGQDQGYEYLVTSTTGQLVHHTYYSLSYSEAHEQAEWVAYELTRERVQGTVPRSNNFRMDRRVRTRSSKYEDFHESGYDRGHLVPAGDMKFAPRAMDETFYYSNMSPQKNEFNGRIWNQLEMQVREWAEEHEHLYVVTGPVLHMPLEHIGPNRVSVPSHYFKVLLDLREPDLKAIAFLMPHRELEGPLSDYVVSVDSLEAFTGLDFFYTFPDSLMRELEAAFDPDRWFAPPKQPRKPRLTILANQASAFVGQKCVVCGTVVDTYANAKITHLNFDKAYPDQPFSAVIFADYRKNFDWEPSTYLKGKQVCVEGKVETYNDKPQIVLRHPNQLRVVE